MSTLNLGNPRLCSTPMADMRGPAPWDDPCTCINHMTALRLDPDASCASNRLAGLLPLRRAQRCERALRAYPRQRAILNEEAQHDCRDTRRGVNRTERLPCHSNRHVHTPSSCKLTPTAVSPLSPHPPTHRHTHPHSYSSLHVTPSLCRLMGQLKVGVCK